MQLRLQTVYTDSHDEGPSQIQQNIQDSQIVPMEDESPDPLENIGPGKLKFDEASDVPVPMEDEEPYPIEPAINLEPPQSLPKDHFRLFSPEPDFVPDDILKKHYKVMFEIIAAFLESRCQKANVIGVMQNSSLQYADGNQTFYLTIPDSLKKFHTSKRPSTPLLNFLQQLAPPAIEVEPMSFIGMCLILDRFLQKFDERVSAKALNYFSVHALVLTALRIADKLITDEQYFNVDFADAVKLEPPLVLNEFERTLLGSLDYDFSFMDAKSLLGFAKSLFLNKLPAEISTRIQSGITAADRSELIDYFKDWEGSLEQSVSSKKH